jgi:thiol-disulfide isomerase/thioredoxin
VVASTVEAPRSLKEAPGNPGYLARHYGQVFQGGLSFSGFERDRLFWNGPGGTFFDTSPVSGCDSPGDGRGAAFADLDDDGDTDVFVHNVLGDRHQLFRNDVGSAGAWVRVTLAGTRSNRDAVGALVTARANGRVIVRTVQAGSGFTSCSDRRILIGLGDAAALDSLSIRWPSGLRQSVGRLAARRAYRIVEGATHPEEVPVRSPVVLGGSGLIGVKVFPGQRMPALDLETLHDGRFDRARHTGRWLLVNFWHHACVSCLREMPTIEKLARELAERVAVVGVALPNPDRRPVEAKVRAAMKRTGVTYPVALASDRTMAAMFGDGEIPTPTSYLVDPEGNVFQVYQGGDSAPLLEEDLRRRTGSKGAAAPPAPPRTAEKRGR